MYNNLIVICIKMFLNIFKNYYEAKKGGFLSFTAPYFLCESYFLSYNHDKKEDNLFNARNNMCAAIEALIKFKVISRPYIFIRDITASVKEVIPWRCNVVGWDGESCGSFITTNNHIRKETNRLSNNGWTVVIPSHTMYDSEYYSATYPLQEDMPW